VQLQGMGAFVSNDVNPADEPGQKKTMIFAKHMPPWFAEAIATPNDPNAHPTKEVLFINALKTPNSWPAHPSDRYEAIRRRAEEIYVGKGRIPGHDVENWAQAEQEILRASSQTVTRKAIVVKVDGVQYIGQYDPDSSDGYVPGEFGAGASIPVRFRGNKMFIQRLNGKILETIIVNRIG
jgi:hypothetical protein